MATACFNSFIAMKYAKTRTVIEKTIRSKVATMPVDAPLNPEKNVKVKTAITSSIIRTAMSSGTSFLANISFCSRTFITTMVLLKDKITPVNNATPALKPRRSIVWYPKNVTTRNFNRPIRIDRTPSFTNFVMSNSSPIMNSINMAPNSAII